MYENLLGETESEMKQNIVAALLAASITLSPAVALADGVVNLPPLQPGAAATTNPVMPEPITNNALNISSTDSMTLRGRVSSVPRGTMLLIKIEQPVSSFTSRMGDTISATLENDIFVNDAIAIPAGSEIIGQVANISESGHMGKHGEIDVRFHTVKTPDGRIVPISAHIVTNDQTGILKGDTYTKDVLKGIGYAAGGTGVGTLMGTAAGSLIGSAGAGAVFGLGVGAIGGMSYALMRKGKDVTLPANARMSIILDQPVSVNQ